ncbi:MAG TPA: 5'-nucleotidase C-terminal domain-containing protein, partial [Bacillota bacterium]
QAPGSRVFDLTLTDGTPLDLTKTYKVATNNFMFTGGDNYLALKGGTNRIDTQLVIRDEVIKWMKAETAAGHKITWTDTGRSVKAAKP